MNDVKIKYFDFEIVLKDGEPYIRYYNYDIYDRNKTLDVKIDINKFTNEFNIVSFKKNDTFIILIYSLIASYEAFRLSDKYYEIKRNEKNIFDVVVNYEEFIDLELFKRQLLNDYEDYLESLEEE